MQTLKPMLNTVNEYICEKSDDSVEDPEYEAWIATASTEGPIPESEVTLNDPQFIMYTSGTTGKPKGAVLCHQNTMWAAINATQMYPLEYEDIAICSAPLFHIGALNVSFVPNMYKGSQMVIQRSFDPEEALQLIERNRVTIMFGIPVMFLFISQMPTFETADLSSIRFCVTGGSPCPKSLIEDYLKKDITFAQGFGMTETSGPVTALRPDESDTRIGSCGQDMFHVDTKIVDLDGQEVPNGENGEIMIKGPTVFNEYWRKPEETASSFVGDWFYSGDIGYSNPEGYLYVLDRRKDMYISGGGNVYPAEVEDVLMSLPEVADAGVFGTKDEMWGESGVAVVVKPPDLEVT
ncbi:MAG: long-chain fatty acid--CoA ligase, partial [Bacteroidetes bacterium]|nr:long-chain fatty acid--CoA ligase [Bacteroidota bacterium]